MSRKANTVLIGSFVVIGLALCVMAIVIFSSNSIFTKKVMFCAFFDTSLNGLDVGAPVKFKGVKVGSVESIEVIYDSETNEATTAVIFHINASLFKTVTRKKMQIGDYSLFYAEQIANGLAAKLSIESLLTAKLYVGLDYYDRKQPRFLRDINLGRYQQIPSMVTDLDEILAGFDTVLKKLSKFEFDVISRKIVTLLDEFGEKFKKLDLSSINRAMDAIAEVLAFDSSTRESLNDSLEQLAKTLRSLRVFLDYLERNPNAIVAGKAL